MLSILLNESDQTERLYGRDEGEGRMNSVCRPAGVRELATRRESDIRYGSKGIQ